MPGLIEIADLRAMFAVSNDIVDSRLSPHLGAASRRLRGWVGDVVYADALSPTPIDAERKSDLQSAEASLAMHFALLGLNTQLRTSGVVKNERVEGDAVVTYLVPAEIRQLADMYLAAAEEYARAWLVDDSIDMPALKTVNIQ